jgi:tryptophan synthase alpha chain
MSPIKEALEALRGREGALIAYVMGGDPAPRLFREVVGAVVEGGADLLEVGIPFSDPIADGRAIQSASARALRAGVRPKDVLELAGEVKAVYGLPVILMSYYNIIFSQGPARFLERARAKAIDGLIVPDLPLEEARALSRGAGRRGLDLILLATPETPRERLVRIARLTSGFLYLVSLRGVTGAREALSAEAPELIRTARSAVGSGVALAAGFGLSRPEHVRAVLEAGADVAIVGSAIVERAAELAGRGDFSALTRYVRSLKEATKGARSSPWAAA